MWTEDSRKAFNNLKNALCHATMLVHPSNDAAIAEYQDDEEDLAILKNNPRLKMAQILVPDTEKPIYCDVSINNKSPYFPQIFFASYFHLSKSYHIRGLEALRNLSRKDSLGNINKDCQSWCRVCLECQRSKVQRHTKSALMDFKVPPKRSQHVHTDIVGPLTTW
ncbi:retrovirus-related Pol polyprotein from transposon 297 [Nephila pilipes]|uniref:Retrovirus-related Pol polyprotein from transposon 297 n=1 Tax=Nephila pilipes TaxID=299642 RepID=A0A8X6NMZ2_NEPPI|nr:retrovirus-related Pol polyprotein from transposon 297 [Nephila pilipes]